MFFFLWVTLIVSAILYRCIPNIKQEPLWRLHEVNWKNLRPILLRFVLSTALLCGAIVLLKPELFLSFPRAMPETYLRVMLLYPLASAAPQEFIFCTYFFARFAPLFPSPRAMLIASTVVFAYAHVLYVNPVAPLLGLAAGYIFASTYARTHSLALVSIEHAIYGNMLFTIGLGKYFYSGSIGTT